MNRGREEKCNYFGIESVRKVFELLRDTSSSFSAFDSFARKRLPFRFDVFGSCEWGIFLNLEQNVRKMDEI